MKTRSLPRAPPSADLRSNITIPTTYSIISSSRCSISIHYHAWPASLSPPPSSQGLLSRRLFSPPHLPLPSQPAPSLALSLSKLKTTASHQQHRPLINMSTTAVSVLQVSLHSSASRLTGLAISFARSKVIASCYRAGTLDSAQVRQQRLLHYLPQAPSRQPSQLSPQVCLQ